jgi:hypothetical protein
MDPEITLLNIQRPGSDKIGVWLKLTKTEIFAGARLSGLSAA